MKEVVWQSDEDARTASARTEALPGASVFDVMYRGNAISHAGERVRDSTDGARQAAADPVDGGGARLGAALHRRDQGGPRSAASDPAGSGALARKRRRVSSTPTSNAA